MASVEKLQKRLYIRPEFDDARVTVTFEAPKDCTRISWRIASGRKTVGKGTVRRARGPMRFTCEMGDFTPWTVGRPHLYELTLEGKAGREAFTLKHPFGMRKFHVEGRQVYVNNVPFYVRGVIRGREAHDHPNLAGLSDVEYYARYIRAAKTLGFNFIRFHSKVPPKAYFEAADRLGVLTHVEVRKYYGKYQKERELMDHDPVLVKPRDWKDAIRGIRNHASLMAYCLGNEINKPGRNPQVRDREGELRKLDPTRLFIDTCARGEFDREGIDFDVQHMGYFLPLGPHDMMFETSANWGIFGSVEGREMVTGEPGKRTRREIPVDRPIMAHEVCHYVALRDLDTLEKEFKKNGAPKPWWIDELKKLVREKGLEDDYPRMLEASRRWQFIWHKQGLERVRKSPILCGFHFLQLADTNLYENSNGLIDCFDEFKPDVRPADYMEFNGDAVVIADLHRRTFLEGEKLTIPVWLSNCSDALSAEGTLEWTIRAKEGKGASLSCKLLRAALKPGLSRVATIEVTFPKTAKPQALELAISIEPAKGPTVRNRWNLWLYPNRPEALPLKTATVSMSEVNLHRRYPQLDISSDLKKPKQLIIADCFSDPIFAHLAKGGDVLMIYRIEETRARREFSLVGNANPRVPEEKYYFPSTWDRFKAVIWDRGHNLGGFLRPHAAMKGFPNDGMLDFQFAGIIDDCEKFSLDGFPVHVDPIVQGVDKASRDRYDVYTFGLRELQPEWTMRKFAYLLDLKVGKGRLMMCGFNLTGLERDVPEAVAMFESLVACVTSKPWKPKASIPADKLQSWLAAKGRAPRIKEREMTQYWQLDAEPLESAQYWRDAEAWIRRG